MPAALSSSFFKNFLLFYIYGITKSFYNLKKDRRSRRKTRFICAFSTAAPSVFSYSVYLSEKFREEFFEKGVPPGGFPFCRVGVHHVFKEQQFFVKVIDTAIFPGVIRFFSDTRVGLFARLVYFSADAAAVGKAPRNTDSTDGIEPVGILNDLALQG